MKNTYARPLADLGINEILVSKYISMKEAIRVWVGFI
jgi:hypothetical protein